MSRQAEIETLFANFFLHRNCIIENEKNKVLAEESNFIKNYIYCSRDIRVLIAYIYSCTRLFNRISLIRNANNTFNSFLEAREISNILATWDHIKQKARVIHRQLASPSVCVYYSESRDMIDSESLDVFNSTVGREFNVMVNAIANFSSDASGNNLSDSSGVFYPENVTGNNHLVEGSGNSIFIQDAKSNILYFLKTDDNLKSQNYFQVEDTTIYIPKQFVFMKNDKIYINFRKSFLYKDIKRTYVGKHIDIIETKILNDWVAIFDENISNETLLKAYEKSMNILDLLLDISKNQTMNF
jgi:hypothetical protein